MNYITLLSLVVVASYFLVQSFSFFTLELHSKVEPVTSSTKKHQDAVLLRLVESPPITQHSAAFLRKFSCQDHKLVLTKTKRAFPLNNFYEKKNYQEDRNIEIQKKS